MATEKPAAPPRAAKKATSSAGAKKTAAKKTAKTPAKKVVAKTIGGKKTAPETPDEATYEENPVVRVIGETPGVIMVRMGGHEVPWKIVAQCLVCQSPHRMYIENRRLQRRSYEGIAAEVAEMDNPPNQKVPTVDSVRQHFNRGHSAAPQRAVQAVLEAEAQRVGLDETLQDVAVTPHLITNAILERGWQKFVDGQIDVDPNMWMNAVSTKLRMDAESDHGSITADMVIEVLLRLMMMAQTRMDEASYRAMAHEMDSDAVLAPLLRRLSSGGEVVSEDGA